MKQNNDLIGKVITATVQGNYGDYKVCAFLYPQKRVMLQRMDGSIGREFLTPLLREVR